MSFERPHRPRKLLHSLKSNVLWRRCVRARHQKLGAPRRRTDPGTIRRMRVRAMRQGSLASWTRDIRRRYLSTEYGHAALHLYGVIREYQSDSASKRPGLSVAWGSRDGPNNAVPLTIRVQVDNGHSISARIIHEVRREGVETPADSGWHGARGR